MVHSGEEVQERVPSDTDTAASALIIRNILELTHCLICKFQS